MWSCGGPRDACACAVHTIVIVGKDLGGWVQGWSRAPTVGSRCCVLGARAAASRRRATATHTGTLNGSLQPHTLKNPSCVVVSSRCRREARGSGAIGQMWPPCATQRSSTPLVVKMTEAGVHRGFRALRRNVRGRHLGGHVVARRSGLWARWRAVTRPWRLMSDQDTQHAGRSRVWMYGVKNG